MAKARITTEIVNQPRRVKRVELTLTEGEADFLLAVLCKVGGSSEKSPRKYQERIQEALVTATGTTYKDTDAYPLSWGSIGFDDYADPNAGKQLATEHA